MVDFEHLSKSGLSLVEAEQQTMVAHESWFYVSPEEYLRREKEAGTKSEYINGIIVGMAGESDRHAAIQMSLYGETYAYLRRAGCRGYSADMRVRIKAANCYYYPDFAIVCGKPDIENLQGVDSIRNPNIIFEILSPSTERVDRIEKFSAYKTLSSFTTYVLIHQDRPAVEVYTRVTASQEWTGSEVTGIEQTFHLDSIQCDLALALIYADLAFEQAG